MTLARTVDYIIGRNSELMDIESFIVGSNYMCFLLWRKMVSLSSKDLHYTNVLENIDQDNDSQCLCSQDRQKHERPMENSHPKYTEVKARARN